MLDFMYQVYPAIERALLIDLPDVLIHPIGKTGQPFLRRPLRSELNIWVFPQVWTTHSLGFASQRDEAEALPAAQCAAYTTVIIHECEVAAVYFGGTFAYLAPLSTDLMADIRFGVMRHVRNKSYYGQVPAMEKDENHSREDLGAPVSGT